MIALKVILRGKYDWASFVQGCSRVLSRAVGEQSDILFVLSLLYFYISMHATQSHGSVEDPLHKKVNM